MRNRFFGDFDERIGRIDRKHRQMERGYRPEMDDTGLIQMRPNSSVRRAFVKPPFRAIGLFIIGLTLFKAVLLVDLGPSNYASRIDMLREGAIWEKAGAWAMQADPVTKAIADQVSPYLRPYL